MLLYPLVGGIYMNNYEVNEDTYAVISENGKTKIRCKNIII